MCGNQYCSPGSSTRTLTTRPLPLWWDGRQGHILDLFNQELALIDELLIVGAILEEVRQEGQELLPVHQKDLLHSDRLMGVCDEDLEDVKAFVLNHFSVIAQQVHADLEVLASIHVGRHDAIVGTVEEDFAEQLD